MEQQTVVILAASGLCLRLFGGSAGFLTLDPCRSVPDNFPTGWTLADMITDDQYARLAAQAKTEVAHLIDDNGQVGSQPPDPITTALVVA